MADGLNFSINQMFTNHKCSDEPITYSSYIVPPDSTANNTNMNTNTSTSNTNTNMNGSPRIIGNIISDSKSTIEMNQVSILPQQQPEQPEQHNGHQSPSNTSHPLPPLESPLKLSRGNVERASLPETEENTNHTDSTNINNNDNRKHKREDQLPPSPTEDKTKYQKIVRNFFHL